MKRIVRLTESDLTRLVKRVIKEYRPYGKSLQDLEDSFWNKDEFLGDMQWGLHNKVYEPNKQKHYEKLNNLKTYYADKMVYDFLQNPNFTSEENTKLEELDEKLSNPNLGSDKIERFKNLKREIYQKAFDRYLDTLDKRHLDQYFIGQKYPYFKDKIKDFVYTGNAPSEPMTPNPNFIQRTAKKVKDYFRSSENEKLTERDLTRIVKRVISESKNFKKDLDLKTKLDDMFFGQDEGNLFSDAGEFGYLSQENRLKKKISPKQRKERIQQVISDLEGYLQYLKSDRENEEDVWIENPEYDSVWSSIDTGESENEEDNQRELEKKLGVEEGYKKRYRRY
jgi:hypothetical protein